MKTKFTPNERSNVIQKKFRIKMTENQDITMSDF